MQVFPNALHVPTYSKKETTSKYSVTLEKRSLVLVHSQQVYMKGSLKKYSIFNWDLHVSSSMNYFTAPLAKLGKPVKSLQGRLV